ncbi:selenide, water dikinase SelD [bacterium]|nr:selenide, water dikinase SelD [bacterium]
MGPEDLREIIRHFQAERAENLLVGLETSDDAGVYRLSLELALVQTLDFITPIVQDPFAFGRIAAANSLSDVYAMGGRPLTALNICCFPAKGLPKSELARILEGGYDAIREAGAALAGGHTIKDAELKYGLSVTGVVHPRRILTNAGARVGDRLILTKPLGTATLFTGRGKGELTDDDVAPAVAGMGTLNKRAAEILDAFVEDGAADRAGPATRGVHALTDVTGYGLAGHALEMARGAGLCLRLEAAALPAYPHALAMLGKEQLCGGSRANRRAVEPLLTLGAGVGEARLWLACDAQTSGGLLIAVAEAEAAALLAALRAGGVADAALIGSVERGEPGTLEIA